MDYRTFSSVTLNQSPVVMKLWLCGSRCLWLCDSVAVAPRLWLRLPEPPHTVTESRVTGCTNPLCQHIPAPSFVAVTPDLGNSAGSGSLGGDARPRRESMRARRLAMPSHALVPPPDARSSLQVPATVSHSTASSLPTLQPRQAPSASRPAPARRLPMSLPC